MKTGLEKFIEDNHDDLDKRVPDAAVLNRILQQMAEVKPIIQQPKGILIPFGILKWAAAALVLLACGITFYIIQQNKNVQLAATNPKNSKTITRLHTDTAEEPALKQAAITTLPEQKNREQIDREIAQQKATLMVKFTTNNSERKLVIMAGLKDMDSPARRIRAVAQSDNFKMIGRDITAALFYTLNNDPNINVRLAALDGLTRFYHETYIRKQLIISLKKQQNPTVQIALIELLTRMKEAAILTELDKIVANDSTMNAVKDCAYSGILKLRKS